MARHQVLVTLPPRKLNRADATFEVKRDGQLFGTLYVSNGSLVWFPRNTSYGFKMGWKKFHKMMEQNATKEERR